MFRYILITLLLSFSKALSPQQLSRRSVIQNTLTQSVGLVFSAPLISTAIDDDLTRGGVPLTPFNGLAFQYRGGNVNTGLDASTLNEPSISYMDFLDRLDKGQVEFVEFMAPNGDAAYVRFKDIEGGQSLKPIRIGEGYPIEDPEVCIELRRQFYFTL